MFGFGVLLPSLLNVEVKISMMVMMAVWLCSKMTGHQSVLDTVSNIFHPVESKRERKLKTISLHLHFAGK